MARTKGSTMPIVRCVCAVCGKTFGSGSARARYCSGQCKEVGRRLRGPFTCGACGRPFYTKRQAGEGEQFCCRACAFSWQAATAAVRAVEKAASPAKIGSCGACGQAMEMDQPHRRYCSAQCRNRASYCRSDAARAACVPRPCSVCARAYTPPRVQGQHAVCSDQCRDEARRRTHRVGQRVRRRRERAQRVGPWIDALLVCRRDNWTCAACGCHTPPHLRGTTDDNAPETDHKVALAHGGEHSYETFTCCAACATP